MAKKTVQIKADPIDPTRNYSRREAAAACRVSLPTIDRAQSRGFLSCFRIGRRVIFRGDQLTAWLQAGGKTGQTLQLQTAAD